MAKRALRPVRLVINSSERTIVREGLELPAHSDLRGSGRRNDVDGCAQPLRVIDVVEDVLSEVRGVEEVEHLEHQLEARFSAQG